MSKNSTAALSPKDVATIMKLRKQGKTLKEVGKAIHRSDKVVSAYLKSQGIGVAPARVEVAPVKKPAKCKKPCCKPTAKKADIPANAVPGFDVVQVKITENQKKALFMASKILALADELDKVFANFFKKAL